MNLSTKETRLPNNIIIYNNNYKIDVLSNLVYKFLSLQLNTKFINILKDKQIRILLRDDQ